MKKLKEVKEKPLEKIKRKPKPVYSLQKHIEDHKYIEKYHQIVTDIN